MVDSSAAGVEGTGSDPGRVFVAGIETMTPEITGRL